MAARRSYFHRGEGAALLGRTIPEHLSVTVERFPSHEALVCRPQRRRLSYSELAREADRLARGLVAMGVTRGDRVGIWSTNNLEWVLLQLATARIGAILVTINPAYRARELAHALRRSEVQALFVIPAFRSSDYVGMLLQLIPELRVQPGARIESEPFPALRHVILYDPADPNQTLRPEPGFRIWLEVVRGGADIPIEQLDRISDSLDFDDPINIQYTSGTTGLPKAVVLSHHSILNNAYFSAQTMHFTAEDRLCIPVPFYHCFGMVLANLLCFSVGACAVLACEHFDAGAVLAAIEHERCTALHGVPTMFIAELEHPEFRKFDLSSLRTGIMAGAPCPPSLLQRVMEELHCPEILIGYGETEAAPLTHLTTRDDSPEQRTRTVGRNLPHQEVKIAHLRTGQTVAHGEVGEVCFRGYHLMKEYYGDPEATRQAVDPNGWLHSGDLGTMDGDGYLRITGRLKEMIIRGGENIYPREIEDFIFTHPKVAAVAVIGVPDPFYGEEPMAWIQLRAGATASEQEIRDYCEGRIAHYKIPRYLWFVDEFPMTVTGKVQKFRMREIAIEKLQGASAPS